MTARTECNKEAGTLRVILPYSPEPSANQEDTVPSLRFPFGDDHEKSG